MSSTQTVLLRFKPTYSPAKRHHQLEGQWEQILSSSSGHIPSTRTGSSQELEPDARTRVWSIPSLLPPHPIPEFLHPPNIHPHTHLFLPALGLTGIARSPSRAGLTPLSRISAVHPRPRPTRFTVDSALTSSPLRVPSALRTDFLYRSPDTTTHWTSQTIKARKMFTFTSKS